MELVLTEQQRAIEENVSRICAGFPDAYWAACDEEARLPCRLNMVVPASASPKPPL